MAHLFHRRFIPGTVLAGVAAAAVLTLASGHETYVTGVGGGTVTGEPSRYLFVDLGTLGGAESRALAMNDDGTVVGWSDPGPRPFEPTRRAFIRRLGEPMLELDSLGWGEVEARGINNSEQIVGAYTVSGERHGIFWNEGVPYDLNDVTDIPRSFDEIPGKSLVGPRPCSAPLRMVLEANAINDWSEIVGCGLFYGDDDVHGILLTPREPFNPIEPFFVSEDLGRLPKATDCFAFALNERTEAVGVSGDDAFIWGGAIEALDRQTLVSEARSINNWGTAVGWTGTDSTRPMAARWEGGHRFDLGWDHGSISLANAIADNGYIVGWTASYSPYFDRPRYAMLWEGCIPVFLNVETALPRGVACRLEEATAVDRMGYIAGFADMNGLEHAFLLIPREFAPNNDLLSRR